MGIFKEGLRKLFANLTPFIFDKYSNEYKYKGPLQNFPVSNDTVGHS